MEHLGYYIPDNMRLWKHKTRSKNIPFYETNILFLTLLTYHTTSLPWYPHIPQRCPLGGARPPLYPGEKGTFLFKPER